MPESDARSVVRVCDLVRFSLGFYSLFFLHLSCAFRRPGLLLDTYYPKNKILCRRKKCKLLLLFICCNTIIIESEKTCKFVPLNMSVSTTPTSPDPPKERSFIASIPLEELSEACVLLVCSLQLQVFHFSGRAGQSGCFTSL